MSLNAYHLDIANMPTRKLKNLKQRLIEESIDLHEQAEYVDDEIKSRNKAAHSQPKKEPK